MVKKKKIKLSHIKISNKQYGEKLFGFKIFYEGKKYKKLKVDGSFQFGKNIIELFEKKYGGLKNIKIILSESNNKIECKRGIFNIYLSHKFLNKISSVKFEFDRETKEKILNIYLPQYYPEEFAKNIETNYLTYKKGDIGNILTADNIYSLLSGEDKEKLNKFIPEYIKKEKIYDPKLFKSEIELKTLEDILKEFEKELSGNHTENWWQEYLDKHILIIQQGYIEKIVKLNVALGNTKYPDFMLITHDGYIDILEIKKPNTNLLKLDSGRDNYYYDVEISKAIIQVENYIEYITNNSNTLRSYIKDNFNIDLKIIRPRGFVLAGIANFTKQKEKDDFRLLCQSLRNISIITYDEMENRLSNHISIIKKYSS